MSNDKRDEEKEEEKEQQQQRKNDHFRCLSAFLSSSSDEGMCVNNDHHAWSIEEFSIFKTMYFRKIHDLTSSSYPPLRLPVNLFSYEKRK